MRLKIFLQTTSNAIIPINYQHSLQGLIYQALVSGDEEFALNLHQKGFSADSDNKRQNFKFFCFSGCDFYSRYIFDEKKENFMFKASKDYPLRLTFQIASPKTEFIEHLVNGLFRSGQEINFANNSFVVEKIFTEAASQIDGDEVILKPCFSPIVMRSNTSKMFLTYDQPEINNLLAKNLCSKHNILHPETPSELEKIEFQFMPNLLKPEAPKTKLITFKSKKDGKVIEIKTKGNFVPLQLKAPKEVIQTALDCGIGEKNSSGFGFVELLKV
jgi:CRISPR-associated endoribonuclease Cas6